MYDFKTWLTELGVNVSDGRLEELVQKLETELHWRVGNQLSEQLSDEQLDEFERLNETGDQQAAVAWITANAPNFAETTQRELQQLHDELKNAHDAEALIDFWPNRSTAKP